jgi:NTP pyrophosphatase (non-canonical NTP hydrolase)
MPNAKLTSTLHTIMDYAVIANHDTKTYWSFSDSVMKGNEEQGELSEAIQINMGRMPNKSLKEPVQGEIADCINQVIDLFSVLLVDVHISKQEILGPNELTFDINVRCNQNNIESKEGLHEMIVSYVLDYQMHRQRVIEAKNGCVATLLKPLLCLGVLFHCFDNKISLETIDGGVVCSAMTDLHDNYLLRKFQKWQSVQVSRKI